MVMCFNTKWLMISTIAVDFFVAKEMVLVTATALRGTMPPQPIALPMNFQPIVAPAYEPPKNLPSNNLNPSTNDLLVDNKLRAHPGARVILTDLTGKERAHNGRRGTVIGIPNVYSSSSKPECKPEWFDKWLVRFSFSGKSEDFNLREIDFSDLSFIPIPINPNYNVACVDPVASSGSTEMPRPLRSGNCYGMKLLQKRSDRETMELLSDIERSYPGLLQKWPVKLDPKDGQSTSEPEYFTFNEANLVVSS